MATLQLEPEELRALEESLQLSISDLEVEANHTDSSEFRENLKQKKRILDQVCRKVHASAVPA